MRIEQLTFTRFIAAISIVIFHYGNKSALFNNEYVSDLFRQANIGVSYFFILSGFVMAIAYLSREELNTKQYFINRIARIYPLYLFAILLILLSRLFVYFDTNALLLNIAMIQSWVSRMALTINHPGWSLSVEMFFYLSFPLIFLYIKKYSFRISSSAIVIFWLATQITYHLIIDEKISIPYYLIKDIHYHPIFHLNEFLIGILTGLYFLRTKRDVPRRYTTLKIITLLILLVTALKNPIGLSYHNGLLALLFAPLIFYISISKNRITSFFSKKPFVYLGEISFGIYLFQVPMWRFISDYRLEKYFDITRNINDDNTVLFLVRLTALIIFSAISYEYIETPLRKKIRTLGKRSKERT